MRFWSVLETNDLLMLFEWPKKDPPNQTNLKKQKSAETPETKRDQPSRGGLGGSDRKGEKFGGLEEKREIYTQTRWVERFFVYSNESHV